MVKVTVKMCTIDYSKTIFGLRGVLNVESIIFFSRHISLLAIVYSESFLKLFFLPITNDKRKVGRNKVCQYYYNILPSDHKWGEDDGRKVGRNNVSVLL